MGAPSIEARLTARVFWVIAPALVLVGATSVTVSAYVLDRADRGSAAARAASALRTLRAELSEGDALELARRETLAAGDRDGFRLALRESAAGPWVQGQLRVPAALVALEAGACAAADEQGETWMGCNVSDRELQAVAAVPVGGHRSLVSTLAKSIAAVVLLALMGLAWAVRRAVHGPMGALDHLVSWAEKIAGDDGAPPAPRTETRDLERLARSIDALVRRLFDALARERASSAHIAHELRTPLTSILAELDLLPGGADAIARIREDVTRLGRVIDAILVLSSPPSEGTGAGMVNVADVVRDLAEAPTVIEAPDEALVRGDTHLVSLALRNLLENAAKYSGHPALSVRVAREGGSVLLAVIDDGPGADDAARARMFDRYWRGVADGAGSGLGLALVRAVAERHGGTAEARPNPDGRGLCVAMTLGPLVTWHE